MTFNVDADRPLAVSTPRADPLPQPGRSAVRRAVARAPAPGAPLAARRHHPAAADPAGARPDRPVQRVQAAVRRAEPAGRQRVRDGDHQDAAGRGRQRQLLLAHTASLTSTLADRDAVIGRTIDNLNAVLGTVDARDQQLVHADRASCSGSSAAWPQDREAIGASLTNIAGLADATAGLLKEARPAIRDDVSELGAVAGTLDDNKKVVDEFLQRLPGQAQHASPGPRPTARGSTSTSATSRAASILSNTVTYTPELPLVGCEVRLMREVAGTRGDAVPRAQPGRRSGPSASP